MKLHVNTRKIKEKIQIIWKIDLLEHFVIITWSDVEGVAVSVLFGSVVPVSYSPSNELWDDAEAVPVLDSRFNWFFF